MHRNRGSEVMKGQRSCPKMDIGFLDLISFFPCSLKLRTSPPRPSLTRNQRNLARKKGHLKVCFGLLSVFCSNTVPDKKKNKKRKHAEDEDPVVTEQPKSKKTKKEKKAKPAEGTVQPIEQAVECRSFAPHNKSMLIFPSKRALANPKETKFRGRDPEGRWCMLQEIISFPYSHFSRRREEKEEKASRC